MHIPIPFVLILLLLPLARASAFAALPAQARQSTLSCRRALPLCLSNLDAGQPCATLPTPERLRVPALAPGTYNLTNIRPGVYVYDDGTYLTLILFRASRLALVDFPDSPGSNLPNASQTLLTTATEEVLAGRMPSRVDMIYSHAHFDHIGAATRFAAYARAAFPDAPLRIWGSRATRDAIARSTSGRAPPPTNILGPDARTFAFGDDLAVDLRLLKAHTDSDLLVHIAPRGDLPGVAMLVDVVFPGWSPFSLFAIANDVRNYIEVHRELLKFDFEVFVGGHPKLGARRDVHRNLRFVTDVIDAAAQSSREITPEALGEAGIGRQFDPSAVEFGNIWYGFLGVFRKLEVAGCYRRILEKWGCKLAGLEFTLESHCFVAVSFNLLDV
ncbi:unnamed protein product [Chondrus crispus]|uniref:Metallo-beta-lactamase domain-containing protein n=1 Tax=Chondrus crispus TaxID=2769 RepID=R7Q4Y8_CHOCR|nr:unnamed protein product [Chondrus crispus]CDF33079.1 unnamed protein product [Chondrus crispus]|eukprot:XP_005712882.1 unnamed protein product [Chondrus crispus]